MKDTLAACFAVLAIAAAAVQAAEKPDDRNQPAADQPQATQPPAAAPRRPAGKPADSFTPSEKVGADSAVSFPVDI